MTFPSYPDVCGWNALLPARTPKPAARGEIAAKYAIVGAGFTGLAVARRLSELDPTADIVVLEATTVGEGSSARNSGFLSPTDIPSGTSEADIAKTDAMNRYGIEGFDDLRTLIEHHAIDCDLHRSGRIKAAATQHGSTAVQSLTDIVRTLKLPHAILNRGALKDRIGTSYYDHGLFTEEGYLVQPAALIRGLADNLPNTFQLFENAPVRSIEKAGKWRITTPDARISADVIIMAANAAIKNFGYLRDRLVTIYTYAAITQKLTPADSTKLGTMPSWGLLPSHRLGSTVRRVGPDRLMVRSLYSYERGVSSQAAQDALRQRFHARYPDLAHVDLDYCWGGTTALTMNGSPWWGRIDDGLYTSAGCNGAGIVKGTVLGKRLAESIMGQPVDADVRKHYGTANWIAPEPFRTIGFHAVSTLERRKAGRES